MSRRQFVIHFAKVAGELILELMPNSDRKS